jgi:N6-adenosine-specific RNA methylase IME4
VTHLSLWVPNALLPQGLAVMEAWRFTSKANIVWHKGGKHGGSDGRGVGFHFWNVMERLLFRARGRNAQTLAPGWRQLNRIATRTREHSPKPDEIHPSSRHAGPGRAWSCSHEGSARVGPCGAARRMTTTLPGGRHKPTTR